MGAQVEGTGARRMAIAAAEGGLIAAEEILLLTGAIADLSAASVTVPAECPPRSSHFSVSKLAGLAHQTCCIMGSRRASISVLSRPRAPRAPLSPLCSSARCPASRCCR